MTPESVIGAIRNLHWKYNTLGFGDRKAKCAECQQPWPCRTEEIIAKGSGR
jgi:hypothetical protein